MISGAIYFRWGCFLTSLKWSYLTNWNGENYHGEITGLWGGRRPHLRKELFCFFSNLVAIIISLRLTKIFSGTLTVPELRYLRPSTSKQALSFNPVPIHHQMQGRSITTTQSPANVNSNLLISVLFLICYIYLPLLWFNVFLLSPLETSCHHQ